MSTKTCAICGKPVTETTYRPFCSRRCADVDLQRWFTGRYAIPVEEDDEAAREEESEASGQPGAPRL